MIDFSPFYVALRAWVSAASTVPLVAVLYENEPRPRVPRVWFELRVERVNPEGTDRIYLAPVEGETVEATTGVRLIEVVIACDSFSQASNMIALGYAEAVRVRGVLASKRAILKDACIALFDFGEIVNADYVVDERLISRFELRARFRWVFDAKGAVPSDLASWIAEAEINGLFPPTDEALTP